mgnify:CR=1 FL=1
MTLNANVSGARVLSRRLEGPERGLDALVGLVVLVAELLIGFLAITALYEFGQANYVGDSSNFGFAVALFGSIILVAITTLVYLVRIARGTPRSWSPPLWGAILMTVTLIVGFAIMAIGV